MRKRLLTLAFASVLYCGAKPAFAWPNISSTNPAPANTLIMTATPSVFLEIYDAGPSQAFDADALVYFGKNNAPVGDFPTGGCLLDPYATVNGGIYNNGNSTPLHGSTTLANQINITLPNACWSAGAGTYYLFVYNHSWHQYSQIPFIFTVYGPPSLILTNVTNASRNPNFWVGDTWQIDVQGPPAQAVTLNGTHNGVGTGISAMGNINGTGHRIMSGVFDATTLGSWTETWMVNGITATPMLNFNVSQPPLIISNLTYTDTLHQPLTMPAAAGTTLINVSWMTSLDATCAFGGNPANDNGTAHYVTLSNLTNGFNQSYTLICSQTGNLGNQSPQQLVPVSVAGTVNNPFGFLDTATCSSASGWACDADGFSQSLTVQFFLDSAAGTSLGQTTAVMPRETAVATICGGYPAHGFNYTFPTIQDGHQHLIYAKVLNIGSSGSDQQLSNSPMMTPLCALPPPALAFVGSPTCNTGGSTNVDCSAVPSGTSLVNVVWQTNLNATCAFGGNPSNDNGTTHFATLNVHDNFNQSYTLLCSQSGNLSNQTPQTLMTVNVLGKPPAAVSYNPVSFSFAAIQNQSNPVGQILSISDIAPIGHQDLVWSVTTDQPWLKANRVMPYQETSGTEIPGTSASPPITVSVDITGLPLGSTSGTITLNTNDPNQPVIIIPVSLSVNPQTPITLTDVSNANANLPYVYPNVTYVNAAVQTNVPAVCSVNVDNASLTSPQYNGINTYFVTFGNAQHALAPGSHTAAFQCNATGAQAGTGTAMLTVSFNVDCPTGQQADGQGGCEALAPHIGSLTITNAPASMPINAALQFTTQILDTTGAPLTLSADHLLWLVTPNCGTIDQAGNYQAPSTAATNCSISVTARDAYGDTRTATTGPVNVIAPSNKYQLIVKFKSTTTQLMEAEMPLASMVLSHPQNTQLQSLFTNDSIAAVRPLYSSTLQTMLTTHQTFYQLALATKQKFPVRAARHVGTFNPPELSRIYIVTTNASSQQELQNVLTTLQNDPQVEYAQFDKSYQATTLDPNDPYWVSGQLWNLQKINANQAWDLSTGTGVIVAVIDTGLDYNHPDIQGNVWINPQTGKPGYDFVGSNALYPSPGPDPIDHVGHGTHVSGTIAAQGNNGIGIIGLAWQAQVMPVKVFDDTALGFDTNIEPGIQFAADNGAQVENMSFGGLGNDPALADAIDYAYNLGVVLVAAAGNNSADAGPYTPAGYADVITVSAFDQNDRIAYFSNFGNKIDVAAPGVSILSLEASGTQEGSEAYPGYIYLDGTSMAAPHVAALAALILSQHPDYSNEQVRQVIRNSADDVDTPGFDIHSGYGRINAQAALMTGIPMEAKILSPMANTAINQPTPITGTAQGSGFANYVLEYGVGSAPTTWVPIQTSVTSVNKSTLGLFDPSTLPDGTYVLRLTATDKSGTTYVDRLEIAVQYLTLMSPLPTNYPSVIASYKPGIVIPIIGTANGAALQGFRMEWTNGLNPESPTWSTAGISTLDKGVPIIAGTLGNWDTSVLATAGADFYTLRLVVNDGPLVREARTYVYLEPDLAGPSWPAIVSEAPSSFAQILPIHGSDGSSHLFLGTDSLLWNFKLDGALDGEIFSAPLNGMAAVTKFNGDAQDSIVIPRGGGIELLHSDGSSYKQIADPLYTKGFGNSIALQNIDGGTDPDILSVGIKPDQTGGLFAFNRAGNEISSSYPLHATNASAIRNFVPQEGLALAVHLDHQNRPEIVQTQLDSPTQFTITAYSWDGTPFPAWTNSVFSNAQPIVIEAADLEGSGEMNVVVYYSFNNLNYVTVLNSDGHTKQGWPKPINANYTAPGYMAIGDLNQDGKKEIVATWGDTLAVFNPDGSNLAGWPYHTANGNLFGAVTLGDIDGDGYPNIVTVLLQHTINPFATTSADTSLPTYSDLRLVTFNRDASLSKTWRIQGQNSQYAPLSGVPVIGDLAGDGTTKIALATQLLSPVTGGFVPITSGLLTVFDTGTPYNPNKMPWPYYLHDPQNTGVADPQKTGRVSCSSSAMCGDSTKNYCDASGTCQAIPQLSVVISTPTPNAIFNVGDTTNFAGTMLLPLIINGSAPSYQPTLVISMDTTTVCAGQGLSCDTSLPGSAYGPHIFVSTEAGTHVIVASATVTDISGQLITIGQSQPITISVNAPPALSLSCSPGSGSAYSSNQSVTCTANNPAAAFTMSWWDPNGTRYDEPSVNGMTVTPHFFRLGTWQVCAQDGQGHSWPNPGGCNAPASYLIRTRIVHPRSSGTTPSITPMLTLPSISASASPLSSAIINVQYSYDDDGGNGTAPPVPYGATDVTMNAQLDPNFRGTCTLHFNNRDYSLCMEDPYLGAIQFGGPARPDIYCLTNGNSPLVQGTYPVIPMPALLPAQDYPWTLTCQGSKTVNASGSFTLAATHCQNSSSCDSGFYCNANGLCQTEGNQSATILVTSPTFNTAYQVGQSIDFAATLTGLSSEKVGHAKVAVLMDGNPIASLTPGGAVQPPPAFTADQVGAHKISAALYDTTTLDVSGNPAPLLQSFSFFDVPITINPAATCTATSDCPNGFYCASGNGGKSCQATPQAAVVLDQPTDNAVFFDTDTITFAAHASGIGMFAQSAFNVGIMVDSTTICQSPGTSCNVAQSLHVGSHTVTGIAFVTDSQGNRISVGQSATAAIAVDPGNLVYAPGQLLVRYKSKPTTPSNSAFQVNSTDMLYSDETPGTSGDGLAYVLQGAAYSDLDKAAAVYLQDPNVLSVQPNYLYQPASVSPNDYYWNNYQVNLGKVTTSAMWYLQKLRWPEATTIASNLASTMKIAEIDSGVDLCHPDLQANLDMANALDIVKCPPTSGSGQPDPACKVAHPPQDTNGHGTAVAGILGGVINNTVGVLGVTQAKIIPIKVEDRDWFGYGSKAITSTKAVVDGIRYVWKNQLAKVINISQSTDKNVLFGIDFTPVKDAEYEQEIINAGQKGIIVVRSAGNNNEDVSLRSPDNMTSPYRAIDVGAVAYDNTKIGSSNFGNTIDIAAFGDKVLTTFHAGTYSVNTVPGITGANDPLYGWFNGTSAAAPQVAGAAALLLSVNKDLSLSQVRELFSKSGDQIADGPLLGTSTHAYPSDKPGSQPHSVHRLNIYHALYLLTHPTSPGAPQVTKVSLASFSPLDTMMETFDASNGGSLQFHSTAYDVFSVQLIVNIPNATGCTLTKGSVIFDQSIYPDQYIYTFKANPASSPLPLDTYPYGFSCTDLWGGKVSVSGNFTVLPRAATNVINQMVTPKGMVSVPAIVGATAYDWTLTDSNGTPITTQSTLTPFLDITPLNLSLANYQVQVQARGNSQALGMTQINLSVVSSLAINSARVHPNPWKSSLGSTQIIFDHMPGNSTVKLFTVSGHHVRTLSAPQGMVEWDLTNDSGEKVASGIYLYLMTDGQNNQTHGKVAVIR